MLEIRSVKGTNLIPNEKICYRSTGYQLAMPYHRSTLHSVSTCGVLSNGLIHGIIDNDQQDRYQSLFNNYSVYRNLLNESSSDLFSVSSTLGAP